MKTKALDTLNVIKEIKKKNGFEIIDTHVHPLDVMGVVHHTERVDRYKKKDYQKPTILERFRYGRLEKIGTKLFIDLFPNTVNKMIKSDYEEIHHTQILEEMEESLIDRATLLPVEPFLPTKYVGDIFSNNEKFILLASIDIHNIKKEEIEKTLDDYVNKYKIVGIKLHPNLQNFKPIPEHNDKIIEEKLDKLYNIAVQKNLYLLFHSGTSFFTNHIDNKYGILQRSKTNALLENFCDKSGHSVLFERYKTKIILAHLGHYGMPYYDFERIEKIVTLHDNVFFDTSGVSPYLIKKVLEITGSERIVFGSDGLYNRMIYNLVFLFWGIQKAKMNESKEESFGKIASMNYLNNILSQ